MPAHLEADQARPVHGPTNPMARDADAVLRVGSAIALRPDREREYRRLHAQVFPTVLETLSRVGVRNYHIFVGEVAGLRVLFSYFEFTGPDWGRAQAEIAACPATQRWWTLTAPCQRRLEGTPADQQWLPLERVFGWLANSATEGRR